MGESAEPRKRSKSDADATETQATVGVKVDQYFTLEHLVHFMRIVTANETTMGFFAAVPGVTYQYCRYTDWIGQYLDSLASEERKSPTALSKD